MGNNRIMGVLARSAACMLLFCTTFLFLPAAPVIAQTSGDYTIFNPIVLTGGQCAANQVISDPAGDVSLPHVDVTWISTRLSGETMNAVLHLQDLPNELTFDREGVSGGLEYEWSVVIDVDNNRETGDSYFPYIGADALISATHIVVNPNTPVTQPIADGLQANVWIYNQEQGEWATASDATMTINSDKNTIALSGDIPGINAISQVAFATFDYNPDDVPQTDSSRCNALP